MSTPLVTWLHLTDLHQGMQHQDWLWPTVKAEFFADLQNLRRLVPRVDLLLFTGDLTQRGSRREFERLHETLEEIGRHIGEVFGARPLLVCVPGNHDLVRPKKRTPALLGLERWQDTPEVRQQFFGLADGKEYRRLVEAAFAPYLEFVAALPMQRCWRRPHGAVPGDFALTHEQDGFRLAIIGLNSAFLQLTDARDYEGRLELDPRQLHHACPDAPAWLAEHDAALLLSHHPLSWLDQRRTLPLFRGEIYPPGRFVLHLHGHNHEPQSACVGEAGAAPRHTLLGPSLFGLDGWTDAQGDQHRRVHGYSAGWLTGAAQRLRLHLWPRRMYTRQAGHLRMERDQSWDNLDAQACYTADVPALRPQPPRPDDRGEGSAITLTPRRDRPSRPSAAPYLHPPNAAAFHRAWYVHRPREEALALDELRTPGRLTALYAPRRFGKSQVLHYLCHALREGEVQLHESAPFLVAEASLYLLRQALEQRGQALTEESLLRELARKIAADTQSDPARAEGYFDSGAAPAFALTQFIEDLLRCCPGTFLLALDQGDAIAEDPFRSTFFLMLRNWAEQAGYMPLWRRLRLLLATSLHPVELAVEPTGSPVNLNTPITLGDLDPAQIQALLDKHGVSPEPAEAAQAQALIGGQPYLWHQLAYYAARRGCPIADLLPDEPGSIFDDHLGRLRQRLLRHRLTEAAARLRDGAVRLDRGVYERLFQLGVAVEQRDWSHRLRYPLYTRLFGGEDRR